LRATLLPDIAEPNSFPVPPGDNLPIVIQNFERVALPPSGHAPAKRLPAARAHSGRREGPPHGPLPGIACWAGWILSFPRNEHGWAGRIPNQCARDRAYGSEHHGPRDRPQGSIATAVLSQCSRRGTGEK
jgi:hypothetical protein